MSKQKRVPTPAGHSEEGSQKRLGREAPLTEGSNVPPDTIAFSGGAATLRTVDELPPRSPGNVAETYQSEVVDGLPLGDDASIELWGENMPQSEVDKLISEENYTPKEILFIDAYLTHWNATQAAVDAGYGFGGKTSRAAITRMAFSVKHRPRVKALIKARLEERAMKGNEVIALLGEMARFDLGAFLEETDNPAFPVAIDWNKLLKSGLTRCIRALIPTAHGLRVDTMDPLKALALIGKHLGLFDPEGISSPQAIRERLRGELDRLTDDELRTYVYNLATSTGVAGSSPMGDAQKAELERATAPASVDDRQPTPADPG